MSRSTARDADRLELSRAALEQNRVWYHTIELAPGMVTPGQVDLRRTAPRILPVDASGLRALDVGTFDGFWAFELEARGAEVVAIDVESLDAAEWPPLHRQRLEARMREWDLELGRGFRLASAALASKVRRIECSVYDLTPDRIGGPVELAFSGAILLHLRDPVRALERIHLTLAPGGTLLVLEPVSVRNTLRSPRTPVARFEPLRTRFTWWRPNLAALRAWLRAAGFVDVRVRGLHRPPAARRMRDWYCALEAVRPRAHES